MSSLRDDLASRVYAREMPTGYPSREDLSSVTSACSVCGEDEIPLDWDGRCERCAPKEDESCEDYDDRVREIRRTKS